VLGPPEVYDAVDIIASIASLDIGIRGMQAANAVIPRREKESVADTFFLRESIT
jgi:hypothetical protein